MKLHSTLALVFVSLAFATAALAQEKTAPTKKPRTVASAKPAPAPAQFAPVPRLDVADEEQLLAASQAHLGPYACELKQLLNVSRHQVDGYIIVAFANQVYTMKPVRSTTGALRLEQVAGGPMLLVQIPTKSMLMDTARGKRIVDACIHEIQSKEKDDADSLGMKMDGQVNTADASATAAPKR